MECGNVYSKTVSRAHGRVLPDKPLNTRKSNQPRKALPSLEAENYLTLQWASKKATEESNASPVKMERLVVGQHFRERPDHHDDSDEAEYHQPEEPVNRFPLPRSQSNTEYADRNPIRPGAARTGAGNIRNVIDVPPRPPKRLPGNVAPQIDRNLKPGRQGKIPAERKSQTLGCTETTTKIPPRPVRSLPRDQGSRPCLPPVPHQSGTPVPLSSSKISDLPPTRPLPVTPQHPASHHTHTRTDIPSPDGEEKQVENSRFVGFRSDSGHRHSLDLESHDLDRSYSKQGSSVQDSVRRQHHEWPQVKGETDHSSYTGHSKPVEVSAEQDWYVGAFSRVEAEHALHLVNREGAFLVRDCSRNTSNEPFVLAVFYDNRVFNIQIRYCQESCKYSLGTRIKTNDTFDTVADIIKFHSIFPIMLIDGRNPTAASTPKRHCILMYPITLKDMNQLLGAP